VTACSPAVTSTPTNVPTAIPTVIPTETPPAFALSSPAFANGEAVPKIHSCFGKSLSPALSWDEPPAGTQSFALIVDDPDAGGFVHWVIYNIPADRRGLPEGIETGQELDDGIYQGLSGGAVFGYVGLCPSALHHYSFRLYALDIILEKTQGVGRQLLQEAMQGHILAESELIGTYQP
jgi:Raf kinase inhibitor-like YbhB/YbcL family protein